MKEFYWRLHKIGTLSLVLCLWCSLIWSQNPSFQAITTNDRLSQNSVTSIIQDSFGFIWIATQDGLNKYDGTNFTKYDAYFSDITQKEFSRVGKIYLDSSNRLWRITSDGIIAYYDDRSDSFFPIDTIANASVIIEKEKNEFWLGSFTEGLFHLSLLDLKTEVTQVLPDRAIYNIIPTGSDLLLATDQGVLKYNTITTGQQSLYNSLDNYHISDILQMDDGSMLVSTFNNGLYKSSAAGTVNSIEGLSKNLRIQDLLLSQNKTIWIATYNDGVYSIRNGIISHLLHDPPTKNQISYNDILCIFEDQEKNIWLGSDGGGLLLNKANHKLIYGISNRDIPNRMAVDVTRSISTDKEGNIWIGTSGKGLTVVDPDRTNLRYYSKIEQAPYYIPNQRIMSLFHDDKDRLWVGTQEGGLLSYDEESEEISEVNNALPAKTIWNISAKNKEALWLCTRQEGLILYNTIENTWTQYAPEQEQSLRVLLKDEDQYYIGTDDGNLLLFNEYKSSFTNIPLNIETGGIKSLYLDGNYLWIGTQRKGILILNKINNEIRIINESSGLPNNVIYAILNQNKRYLWISTNKGICQIDKAAFYREEKNIINQYLNYSNGLISNEFNTGAYHIDIDGKMYFGAIDGVNWFNPMEILKDRKPISIVFLELVTNYNDTKNVTTLYNKNEINLPYKNRHFQIRYTDLEFGIKENTLFQYRLKGYSEDWIYNETNKLISFSNVPPGQYKLQIKASHDNILWETKVHEFGIEIIPAFWQTWLFRVAVASLLIYLLWYIINLRIKAIKKAAQLQQELAQSEATALKAQMNPHFLFNSLNAIDNYILNNDSAKASDYLTKFSKLIRQILDYSNQALITLQQEIEILKLYVKMEQLRFPSKFEFDIVLSRNINTQNIKVPPLLIQPYIENAIWHGLMHLEHPGKLEIEFAQEDDFLVCTISDNGIGRIKAQEIKSKSATKRKSHGMKITKDRIRLLNELGTQSGYVKIIDLYGEKNTPSGTKIVIKLPLNADQHNEILHTT